MGAFAIVINNCVGLLMYLSSYVADITATEILIALSIAISIYYAMCTLKYNRSLPPGPWGLPLVGYLPWMLRYSAPHNTYLKLAAQYGDITSLTLGSNLVVCLGSAKLIRELFTRYDSTGRPHTPLNNLLGGRGIVLSEGKLWKEQRQFLYQKFRSLGVKFWENQPFEKVILDEIEELRTNIANLNGTAVDPSKLLDRHIHNVICQFMMSFRFQEGDKELLKFNEQVNEGMRLYGSILIGEHLPLFLRLPGKTMLIKEIERSIQDFNEFHKKHINKRIEQRSKIHLGYTAPPVDLLDCYLDLLDENNDDTIAKVFAGATSVENMVDQMVQVMNDLFSAGMETSLSTLLWTLVMMVREPAVAARVRRDLAKVIAPGEMVTLEHRLRLPYVEAAIYEVLRRVSPVPLGTTHTNIADWNMDNYTIPAGSHVIPLINRIHMDPVAFPDPEKFQPERFLKDGKLQNLDNFMPFGLGRRKCLGEQLARMEAFLFFANFMNGFEFELAEGQEMPGLHGVLGATHQPLPFQLSFTKRALPQPTKAYGRHQSQW